eukprot:764173-Hanusia_phi.AAC.3
MGPCTMLERCFGRRNRLTAEEILPQQATTDQLRHSISSLQQQLASERQAHEKLQLELKRFIQQLQATTKELKQEISSLQDQLANRLELKHHDLQLQTSKDQGREDVPTLKEDTIHGRLESDWALAEDMLEKLKEVFELAQG